MECSLQKEPMFLMVYLKELFLVQRSIESSEDIWLFGRLSPGGLPPLTHKKNGNNNPTCLGSRVAGSEKHGIVFLHN